MLGFSNAMHMPAFSANCINANQKKHVHTPRERKSIHTQEYTDIYMKDITKKPHTVGVKRLEIRSVIGWCAGNYWKIMTRPGSLKN